VRPRELKLSFEWEDSESSLEEKIFKALYVVGLWVQGNASSVPAAFS